VPRPSTRQVRVAAPAGSAAAGADPSCGAARLMPTGPAGLCLCGQGSRLLGSLHGSLERKLGRVSCAPAQGASSDSTAQQSDGRQGSRWSLKVCMHVVVYPGQQLRTATQTESARGAAQWCSLPLLHCRLRLCLKATIARCCICNVCASAVYSMHPP
jgi:hypothetical protein